MPGKADVTLRFLAEPSDVNFGGKVHGGMVMKWIDQAGWAAAVGWSGRYCVTVYVGGIRFLAPILIGNIVEVHAKVIHTGNTSLHLAVDVWAIDSMAETRVQTTNCVIVFVALDDSGKPTAVPKWTPQTDEQRQLCDYAQRLMQLREAIETEMEAFIHEPPDS